jgi:hypothetical protein
MRVPSIALVGAALVAAVLPASAAAQDSSGQAQAASANVSVQLDITRFEATKSGPVARGNAKATLRGLGGMPTTVTQKVTLAQARRGGCRILTLVLNELELTLGPLHRDLLGLVVDLNRVNLTITAIRGAVCSVTCCAGSRRPRRPPHGGSRRRPGVDRLVGVHVLAIADGHLA